MKIISAALLAVSSLFIINNAFAVDVINDTAGKEKIGVVSASNAYSLDGLKNKLSEKAEDEGATSMKIISAGGDNKLFGVAEIYK